MDTIDRAWLAGLLEGEGSFGTQRMGSGNLTAHVMLKMTDYDVVAKASAIMGGMAVIPQKRAQPHHKQAWRVTLKGRSAVAVMREIYPLMGERRQARLREIFAFVESGEIQACGTGNYPRKSPK